MSSIPLVASLPTEQTPLPRTPEEAYARAVSLQGMIQQNQAEQQQTQQRAQAFPVQQQQQEEALKQQQIQTQQQQRALQDQQTVMDTLRQNNGDIAASLPQLAGKVTPSTYMGLADAHLKIQKSLADLTETQLKNKASIHDQFLGLIDDAKQLPPDQYAAQWPQLVAKAKGIDPESAKILDPATVIPQQQLPQLEIGVQTQSAAVANKLKESEVVKNLRGEPLQQELQSYLATPDGQKNGPAGFTAWKAAQEARATQPYKIQVAETEAKAKQLMEGLVKPVYAFDPQTNQKTLMSQTDALQKGLKVIEPVTAKEVGEDTTLNNRLADVHQKIARYEADMNKPLPASDKYVMSKILADDKFKAGAFGTELPVDFLNKLDQARNLGNISKDAQQRLVNYYNARESMQGYQRVLSGSSRGGEKAMQLNLDALPNPIAPEDYSKRSLGAFRENLQIVGQGLPVIPGVKTPDQWEQGIRTSLGAGEGGTVRMKAPNGQTRDIPADQVEHYKSLGAVLAQ